MKKIYVNSSKIQGRGVFAGEDISKGEVIQYIKGKRFVKHNKTIQDSRAHPNWVGVSKYTWIDPAVPFKYLNHSCNPSAGIRGEVSLVALRDIKKDEEINFDYSTTELDENWSLPKCRCGEKDCRGFIGPIQNLSPVYVKKYLPNIPRKIYNIYKRHIIEG